MTTCVVVDLVTMVKRKKADGSESDGDQVIPIPIQTFLWRQTRSVYCAMARGWVGGFGVVYE